jgi:alcohol dehydrogenase class IV
LKSFYVTGFSSFQVAFKTFEIAKLDMPQIVEKAFTSRRMDNNPVDLTSDDVACLLQTVIY